MRNKFLIFICILGLTLFTGASAFATLNLNFGNVDGATINFGGASQFTFPSTGTYDFSITSTSGALNTPSTVGFDGNIGGTFTIGAGTGTASVSGFGTLSIFDGANTLSGVLEWKSIGVQGTGDTLNLLGEINLTSVAYPGGTNPDLKALIGSDIVVLTAQFIPGKTLDDLRTGGFSTSYSGTIAAVPIPPTALLLGTGLLGLVGLGWRRRKVS